MTASITPSQGQLFDAMELLQGPNFRSSLNLVYPGISPETLADEYEQEGLDGLRSARDSMEEMSDALSGFLESTKHRDGQYIALAEELVAIDKKASKSKGFRKKDAPASTEMTATELLAFIEKHARELWANKTALRVAVGDPDVCLHCTISPAFDEVDACRKEVMSWFDLSEVMEAVGKGK